MNQKFVVFLKIVGVLLAVLIFPQLVSMSKPQERQVDSTSENVGKAINTPKKKVIPPIFKNFDKLTDTELEKLYCQRICRKDWE